MRVLSESSAAAGGEKAKETASSRGDHQSRLPLPELPQAKDEKYNYSH